VVIYHIFDVKSCKLLSPSGVKALHFCSIVTPKR